MRAVVAWVIALSFSAGPALADDPATGILPVVGRLARELNPSLGRAVAERGLQAVLGPVEVEARLAADAEVSAALERAREAISLSRERELQMQRDSAVLAAGQAIARLAAVRARYHAPALAARALVTLGLALQLRPADDERTRRALRQALRVDPGYTPPPGQLAPRVTAMLEAERGASRPLAPEVKDLGWLATRLRLSRLVWLDAAGSGAVTVLVYDARTARVQRRVSGTVPARGAVKAVATLVGQALGGPPPRQRQATTPGKTAARPWYRRWWVWAAAGAAVAIGVGVGVRLALRDEPSGGDYDLHLHF